MCQPNYLRRVANTAFDRSLPFNCIEKNGCASMKYRRDQITLSLSSNVCENVNFAHMKMTSFFRFFFRLCDWWWSSYTRIDSVLSIVRSIVPSNAVRVKSSSISHPSPGLAWDMAIARLSQQLRGNEYLLSFFLVFLYLLEICTFHTFSISFLFIIEVAGLCLVPSASFQNILPIKANCLHQEGCSTGEKMI